MSVKVHFFHGGQMSYPAMGDHNINHDEYVHPARGFRKTLEMELSDLERLLDSNLFESGVQRIGAEQEVFLIDNEQRPSPLAAEVLKLANNRQLTTEIALFNLEANLTPSLIDGRCFSRLEQELTDLLGSARTTAKSLGADILLTGILPTIQMSDLRLANLTPNPRYQIVNQALSRLHKGKFFINVKGLDELKFTHNNVLPLGCNSSFQIHLQVEPRDFASLYNVAQVVTAPVLAAAVNSPLLLGCRLWQETRIELIQQVINGSRNVTPMRVDFGATWVRDSVVELFRENLSCFGAILTTSVKDSPQKLVGERGIPGLPALCVHNGTVWRWNRPCYGITGGRPHLRIEARALPSGPSIVDEVANAAFFVGLAFAMGKEHGRIDAVMAFHEAKDNFYSAARYGLDAKFTWVGGKSFSAARLIIDHLISLASEGLRDMGVDVADSDRYLGVIEERVRSRKTGSRWILDAFSALNSGAPSDESCETLVSVLLEHEQSGEPVHRWPQVKVTGKGFSAASD
jgi:hypothetical protein